MKTARRLVREEQAVANAPKMITCEVQSGNEWTTISIDEALARRERNGRCVECHMPVRAHRQANNGMAAHFEHLAKNPLCPLSDRRHAGHGDGLPQQRVAQPTVAAKAVAADTRPEPRSVAPVSVDDLAELRRQLAALLNTIDGGSGGQDGRIRHRISQLSRDGGPVPREIAALMVIITEMRNSAEYRSKVLSASECAAVQHAWQAIQEWARVRKSVP